MCIYTPDLIVFSNYPNIIPGPGIYPSHSGVYFILVSLGLDGKHFCFFKAQADGKFGSFRSPTGWVVDDPVFFFGYE